MKNQKSLTKPGSFISDVFGAFKLGNVQHTLGKSTALMQLELFSLIFDYFENIIFKLN